MTFKHGFAFILITASNAALADSVMAPLLANGQFEQTARTPASVDLFNPTSIVDQSPFSDGSSHPAKPTTTAPINNVSIVEKNVPQTPVQPIVLTTPQAPAPPNVMNQPALIIGSPVTSPTITIPNNAFNGTPPSWMPQPQSTTTFNPYTTPSNRWFSGVNPADLSTSSNSVTEAGLVAPAICNTCGNVPERIVVPGQRVAANQTVRQRAPPPGDENLSCGQRALLKAAKRLAPKHGTGLCGPVVVGFIHQVEKEYPGFDKPSLPNTGRYPMPTRYSEGIFGYLQNRGWTQLDASNGYSKPSQLPPGSVLIFQGPNNSKYYAKGMSHPGNYVGHVTVKGNDGLWYTDGITVNPAIVNRFFKAAFIPGPTQNAACGDK